MSGIYIKGMEMPKRGHTVTITIVGSGETYVEYYDCKPHVEETIEYKAIPVPPHGRLIDASALTYLMGMDEHFSPLEAMYLMELIADAPTIIESEGE